MKAPIYVPMGVASLEEAGIHIDKGAKAKERKHRQARPSVTSTGRNVRRSREEVAGWHSYYMSDPGFRIADVASHFSVSQAVVHKWFVFFGFETKSKRRTQK